MRGTVDEEMSAGIVVEVSSVAVVVVRRRWPRGEEVEEEVAVVVVEVLDTTVDGIVVHFVVDLVAVLVMVFPT